MNNMLQIERDVSNNLQIENLKLKAKSGELESYKVNGQNQCSTSSAMDISSPDSCNHCRCLAPKPNESMVTNRAFLESKINDVIQFLKA